MKAKAMIELDSAEISALQYPVVVEMWDKKNYGRIQRAWLGEFSEPERKKAGEWYRKFYRWYLVSGPPQRLTIHAETLPFLRRLVNFFGTV